MTSHKLNVESAYEARKRLEEFSYRLEKSRDVAASFTSLDPQDKFLIIQKQLERKGSQFRSGPKDVRVKSFYL